MVPTVAVEQNTIGAEETDELIPPFIIPDEENVFPTEVHAAG